MMKKHHYIFFTVCLFSIVFAALSCSSDDNDGIPDPNDDMGTVDDDGMSSEIEAAQQATTTAITGGSSRTWRITSAQLTNSGGTIDVSDNFNIVDDEFIFISNDIGGTLEWRPGFAINPDGTSAQDVANDYYIAPVQYPFIFEPESSDQLNSIDGNFTFTVIDENTITGTIAYPVRAAEGMLQITMGEKTSEDYAAPPTGGLTFSSSLTFESGGIRGFAPGMIGSYSDNSLFFVTREDGLNDGTASPERIIKFNLDEGTTEDNLYFNADFVSKQLHIIDNELVVIGGQNVNTYPLDLSGDPTTNAHGLQITRHGMAVQGDVAYIIGGDLNNPPVNGNKVFGYDLTTQTTAEVATLPENRYGARASIVNDKLYIFGGTVDQFGETALNTLYIQDFASGSLTTETMTTGAHYTFVDKFENLIYVAGQIDVRDGSGVIVGNDYFIGVYDTNTGTYEEIPTNLTSGTEFFTIHGMCIFNGNMYIIFGGVGEDNGGDFPEWEILSAPIN
ncbi:Kelch repeat-containing protein [Altibacter sp. HG106]|uniref:Kelch repeat-containing protein n=1 Tax=Altibacter sp. HG106 TaxID=3023937 RepID=UPI002350BD5A|nr:kelch repeat-containing protein [Altibacter sp. HG106]MDC7994020.1 kelch repeat-containing protein [Altibacter sp. HG106]